MRMKSETKIATENETAKEKRFTGNRRVVEVVVVVGLGQFTHVKLCERWFVVCVCPMSLLVCYFNGACDDGRRRLSSFLDFFFV